MNSVIVIENIMDKWLENQPEPTIYYRCKKCLFDHKDIQGLQVVEPDDKDKNNQIEMIDCCIF